MIKNIIFDFGDIFINLDKAATLRELDHLGMKEPDPNLMELFLAYEKGIFSTEEFIEHVRPFFPEATDENLKMAWNAILLDFPDYRIEFLESLVANDTYRLFLLSNTNELHIDWIKNNISFYNEFKQCFNAFYLSHEIHLRKPTPAIFNFVLDQHQLQASETLFIDDTKANTDTAKKLGIHIWNNDPKKDDITHLFEIKSNLF